ncbi:hypothetical protein B0J12DRAFT_662291 [Macrophomina phaseolina]|uniref:Amidohydrolase-related domain-containing protein n=1 Tax=Macrophomina phaseolina TaxID=35725 RepID=A0ABQ8GBT9_9PEZI|nr:hypothetical protein B0J12DRAFT_662291 [Macrophomina phaseolina]
MPRRVWRRVEEAFSLGTVKGARALGLERKVGRLREGMKAGVVVWEGRSPGMVCAAQEDAVAAVVLHSSPQHIDVVIVDGVVRKREGRIVEMNVEEDAREIVGKNRVEWKDVARELLKSREALQERAKGIDHEKAKQVLIKTWNVDESRVVDEV